MDFCHNLHSNDTKILFCGHVSPLKKGGNYHTNTHLSTISLCIYTIGGSFNEYKIQVASCYKNYGGIKTEIMIKIKKQKGKLKYYKTIEREALYFYHNWKMV